MKALLFTALFSLPAFAGEMLPQAGQDYVGLVPMSLYDSTPDPSFGTKGNQIGRIQRDDVVHVIETRQYVSSVMGTEIWVEVEKDGEPAVHGWVLAGVSGGNSKLGPVNAAAEARAEDEVQVSSYN